MGSLLFWYWWQGSSIPVTPETFVRLKDVGQGQSHIAGESARIPSLISESQREPTIVGESAQF